MPTQASASHVLQAYQKEFIEFALARQVLKFGEFTLKSGRVSPYFFNAGLFNDGEALLKLGQFYAKAIEQAELDYDVLFGPAYKGIPLGTSTAVALQANGRNVPFCFNRKEAKAHGEGGSLVGAPLKGGVLIIDDVITAGTAIREVMEIIAQSPDAKPIGVVVAMDRQEKGQGVLSAIQEVERDYGIPVISIVNLGQVLAFVETDPQLAHYSDAITRYRDTHGISV